MDWEPLIRVGFAALLSLPIGLERELRGKPAGLRTHVVVATACAAFGYLSVITAEGIAGADRTRIASTVVTGVGFIGAGVTFAAGGKVHGLTTAAAIFSAAAVGLTVGMGHTELGAALVAVTVLFLWPVERLTSGWLAARRVDERIFHFVARDIAVIAEAQETIGRHGAPSGSLELRPFNDVIGATMAVPCTQDQARAIYADLNRIEGLDFVTDESSAGRDD